MINIHDYKDFIDRVEQVYLFKPQEEDQKHTLEIKDIIAPLDLISKLLVLRGAIVVETC